MIPNLDVDQLKTFLAIADTGSFTKAADEVNKTQSAVSMQVKRLEEILGRELFRREGRGSKLSAEGERFIDHARRLVALNDEVVLAYNQPAISGTVRFGTPDDYADLFVPEVLARFSRSHPMVTVNVECVGSISLVERVKRGEIDIALVTFCCDERDGEVLRSERLHWVTSSRHSVHLSPVVPLATADIGCAWRRYATDALTAVNRKHRVAYTSANRAVVDAAVLQGLAIAVMPEICVRPGMRVLTAADGFAPLAEFEIGLVRKPGKLSQAAEALANYIRESFGRTESRIIAAE